jgi:hypothetical protein
MIRIKRVSKNFFYFIYFIKFLIAMDNQIQSDSLNSTNEVSNFDRIKRNHSY